MTSTIALIERLKDIYESDDHARGCKGREYDCSCGFDERTFKTAEDAATELTTLQRNLQGKQEAADYWQKRCEKAEARADTAEAALVEARELAIRECAKIAFTWRTSATVRVGEYIAKAILALSSNNKADVK